MFHWILKGSIIKGFASTVPKTRISTLQNGMTATTNFIPNTVSATIGVFVSVRSFTENIQNIGTAHFLEYLAFEDT